MLTAKTTLMGNIGKMEPQYTPNGTYFVKGTIAVNIGRGDKKETDWYNFVVWGKTGELFTQFCKVGTRVLIEGPQRIKKWNTEKSSGTSVDITVSDFDVISNGRGRDEDGDNPYNEDAVAVDQMLDGQHY